MSRIISYFIVFITSIATINGQENPPAPTPPPNHSSEMPAAPKDFNSFKDRIYVGGNVGAWFGTSTYINLSPIVGCKITKDFSIGVSGTYNYNSISYGGKKFISTIYGGGAFGRYIFRENFFAQVGIERLSVLDYRAILPDSRVWVDNILVGGGYRQLFSERGSFVAAIFYNVNQTPLSPYPNPIIQFGFNIGL